MNPGLGHVVLDVSHYDATKAFYESALVPLEVTV
jgi:hypothetical protein